MNDVQTLEERAGAQAAGRAIELRRADASQEILANRSEFDIANLTDQEFDAGLVRIETRQRRMAKILDTVLKPDIHYGNPKTRDGKGVFPKPILYQAGAEELRNLFRLQLRHASPPVVVETKEYCSVTVTLGVLDASGRFLAPRSGSCNTMEKRFERRDGKGYTYKDAREMLHQCFAMAEKRAGAFATKEVTGANAFFSAADEDAMREALGIEADGAEASPPWTKEEKAAFLREALAQGIVSKEAFAAFVVGTVGDRAVLQSDLPTLRSALANYKAPGTKPVRAAEFDDVDDDTTTGGADAVE